MDAFRLSRTEKNNVFVLAGKHGLATEAFGWSESEESTTLVHRPTGCRIQFRSNLGEGRYVTWWPAVARHKGWAGYSSSSEHVVTASWQTLEAVIDTWLGVVAENDSSPDLWAIAAHQASSLPVTHPTDNSAFSPKEVLALRAAITEVRAVVAAATSLNQSQSERVDQLLTYLADAAPRQGRFDWTNILMGTVIQLVAGGVLDATNWPVVWAAILRHVGGVLGWVRQLTT